MNTIKITDYMKDNLLIFDGAMGTMLQDAGLKAGGLPEIYNIEKPEIVLEIHKKYVTAGADVVTANTFQANELKLDGSGYSPEEIIGAGIELARRSGAKYVALDLGPLGQLMRPMGMLTFDDAYEMYKRQILAGSEADVVLLETQADLLEVRAAVLAARENSDLPVFVTMTFQEDGRTFVGCDPVSCAVSLSALHVDALGVNCSLGPKELTEIAENIINYSRVPVMLQPNAGLPRIENGRTVYDVAPSEYAEFMANAADMGVHVLGGCCGTTPEFIREMKTSLINMKPKKTEPESVTAICSGSKTVIFDDGVSVIGERINPTGKKVLKERLRAQDFDYIIGEAISQAKAGADILDVNCGLPEIDEAETLVRAVGEIQSVTNLPLQLDSSDPKAIEKALRIYCGKPIINSVNGKRESMDDIFPIAAKYGAAVVGLCLDEDGIPETAEGRFKIAEKIVSEAAKYGIPKQDIVIDTLVLTASAQQEQVMATINAIKLIDERLGVKTVLGVSNVSFGLPCRPMLNAAFLAAGFGAGLSSAIINPLNSEVMNTVRAFRVLNNQDKSAEEYISVFSQCGQTSATSLAQGANDLKTLIIDGRREEAAAAVRELLKTEDALKIIDGFFVPALDEVGEKYEKGVIFLPQLIRSAEAVKSGFEVLKANMEAADASVSKGKVIVATVEGDIHDIGKNIAKMLLENYGYEVRDLGKDVPIEEVVRVAKESGAKLIGLSALMTTTVKNMRDTISALRMDGCDAKIMVGGAVLNDEYVGFVGADYYAKDARAGVEIAKKVLGE